MSGTNQIVDAVQEKHFHQMILEHCNLSKKDPHELWIYYNSEATIIGSDQQSCRSHLNSRFFFFWCSQWEKNVVKSFSTSFFHGCRAAVGELKTLWAVAHNHVMQLMKMAFLISAFDYYSVLLQYGDHMDDYIIILFEILALSIVSL